MRFRSGFVAVVGRPNVGKSSLVNSLVGEKVAIVSDKPQTTRLAGRSILTGEDHQIVFIDTPGFHKPRTLLGERLNLAVADAVGQVDAVFLVVDAASGVGRGDAFVAQEQVASHAGQKICAVNKIDLLRHHAVVPQLVAAAELAPFDHVVPVSAKTGAGLDELLNVLVKGLPEGDLLYPLGQTVDQPLEVRIAEVIREKALAVLRDELPHSIAVVVDEIERDAESGLVRVSAQIFVERESQKGIVVGKSGRVLKEVGIKARREVEALVSARVVLDLRVKVQKEWQRDPKALVRLGL